MNSSTPVTNPYGIRLHTGWKETSLAELVNHGDGFISTGPFGSQLHAHDYKPEGTPVVMPQQLGDNQISLEGIARISDEDRDRLSRHVMEEGDIVFSRRGDVTRRSYIGPDEAGWLCGTGCLLIRVKHKECNNQFLSLFFSLPQFKEYITQKAVGATMPNLNQGILGRVPVILPPIDCQRRIFETLSTYDDLIENNRRRMALLEESARQLYQEWFVRLRFPGHEHTRITNGVPEGWEATTLGKRATLNYGKALKAEDRTDGPWPVYGSSGIVGTHEKALAPAPGIVVGRKGNVGSVYWCPKDYWPIDTVYFIDSETSTLWLYYALQHIHFISTDVAVPGLNRDFAYSRPLLVPFASFVRDFHDVVVPIHEQIVKLGEIIEKLRTARDLLLPRLMSGDINI